MSHDGDIHGPFTTTALIEFFEQRKLPGSTPVRLEGDSAWIPFKQVRNASFGLTAAKGEFSSVHHTTELIIYFRLFMCFTITGIATSLWAISNINSWAITSAVLFSGNLESIVGPLLLGIASSITAYVFAGRILSRHARLLTEFSTEDEPITSGFFKAGRLAALTNQMAAHQLGKPHVINPVLAQMYMVIGPMSLFPFIGHYFFLTFLLVMPGLVAQFSHASRDLALSFN